MVTSTITLLNIKIDWDTATDSYVFYRLLSTTYFEKLVY